MSAEQNKTIVKRYIQAFSEHKPEWIDDLLHEDYSIRGSSESPWETVLQGKEAVRQAIDQTFKDDPTWHIVIDDIIAEGDKVAVRETWVSHGQPTDSVMVFYRLVDGKIIDDFFCATPLKK